MLSAFGDRNNSFKSEAAGLGAGLLQQYIKDRLCHACYELMANPVISEYLVELFWEEAFNHRVAYRRIYYPYKPQMAYRLGLYAWTSLDTEASPRYP